MPGSRAVVCDEDDRVELLERTLLLDTVLELDTELDDTELEDTELDDSEVLLVPEELLGSAELEETPEDDDARLLELDTTLELDDAPEVSVPMTMPRPTVLM